MSRSSPNGFIATGAFGHTHVHVAGSQESKECSNSENPKNPKDLDWFGLEHFVCFSHNYHDRWSTGTLWILRHQ